MEWEQAPTHARPSRVGRVLLGLVVVAAALLAARGLADGGAPSEDDLTVVEATTTPSPTATAGPAVALPVRSGTWRTLPLPEVLVEGPAAAGAVGRPVVARLTDSGIVVLRGRAVAVLNPGEGVWGTLPDFPGGAGTPRTAVATDAGLLVVELTEDGPVVWRLATAATAATAEAAAPTPEAAPSSTPGPTPPPDRRWVAVDAPPVDRLDALAPMGDAAVVVGVVDGQPGQQVAVLDVTSGTWTVQADPPADVEALQVAFGPDGLLLLGLRRGSAGTPGAPRPALLRLDDDGWTSLTAPPPDLLGTSAVLVGDVAGRGGPPGAPARQLVALDTDVGGAALLSRYDVGVDRWVAVPLRLGDAVPAGTLLQGSWTGGPTVWFRSFGADSTLLALDLPLADGPVQGPLQVGTPTLVEQPDGVMTSSYPIAVDDGVCLVPGRAQPPTADDEVVRCWSPATPPGSPAGPSGRSRPAR